jgi:hypothetical protein
MNKYNVGDKFRYKSEKTIEITGMDDLCPESTLYVLNDYIEGPFFNYYKASPDYIKELVDSGVLVPEQSTKIVNKHQGHEIVDNVALNKVFKYCRDCKEEVT